jgi:uncharacterized protein YeaO (DUF488 family)
MNVGIKRVYDEPVISDGYRVLVDRLWPRGVKKELLLLDKWCKDVAPSSDLRTWFGHDPAKFEEFSDLYEAELERSHAPGQLLERARAHDTLTLLYAAKDPKVNHALVLQRHLKSLQ